MVNTYRLINPHIKGEFKTSLKSRNSIEAGKKFYKNLSEHFNNNIPEFHFTIQKGSSGSGKYYHFKVQEKREGEEVNFSIQPQEVKGEKNAIKKFNKRLNVFETKIGGGKKKRKREKRKKMILIPILILMMIPHRITTKEQQLISQVLIIQYGTGGMTHIYMD